MYPHVYTRKYHWADFFLFDKNSSYQDESAEFEYKTIAKNGTSCRVKILPKVIEKFSIETIETFAKSLTKEELASKVKSIDDIIASIKASQAES